MSCHNYRLDILNLLDSGAGVSEPAAARAHLKACEACRTFYEEEVAVNRLLQEPELERELPPALWSQIERRIAQQASSGNLTISERFALWFQSLAQQPLPRFGLAALIVLVLISFSLLQLPTESNSVLLAQLDQYSFEGETSGNPFLSPAVSEQNPFLSEAWNPGISNPFKAARRRP